MTVATGVAPVAIPAGATSPAFVTAGYTASVASRTSCLILHVAVPSTFISTAVPSLAVPVAVTAPVTMAITLAAVVAVALVAVIVILGTRLLRGAWSCIRRGVKKSFHVET